MVLVVVVDDDTSDLSIRVPSSSFDNDKGSSSNEFVFLPVSDEKPVKAEEPQMAVARTRKVNDVFIVCFCLFLCLDCFLLDV